MIPFGFKQIVGMSSWAVVIVALLCVAGFFALPVLLAVGAVFGLALIFGKGQY